VGALPSQTAPPPPPPTKAPVPDPAPPSTCNQGQALPEYAEDNTFNRDAAKPAIELFCKEKPYNFEQNAAITCPSWQSYAFDGSKINSVGQNGVLGDVSRIYLTMR
jgi:hypothetical protein